MVFKRLIRTHFHIAKFSSLGILKFFALFYHLSFIISVTYSMPAFQFCIVVTTLHQSHGITRFQGHGSCFNAGKFRSRELQKFGNETLPIYPQQLGRCLPGLKTSPFYGQWGQTPSTTWTPSICALNWSANKVRATDGVQRDWSSM